MAVKRRVNIVSQLRVDAPDMRALESGASNDFDELIKSLITGTTNGFVLRGFEISMTGAIGAAANSLQMLVDPGAVLHINSSQSGTFYLVPPGTSSQQLNAATNTIVDGAFSPSSVNYVGIEYERFVDDTTSAQVYLWNPTTNSETTKNVPRAQILRYRIKISNTQPDSTVLPIAKITTDSGNNVTLVQDCRYDLFRLGQGGWNPDATYKFPWTGQSEGRLENANSSSTNGISPFRGGDKMLGSLKDWMDAVMTSIKELKGSPFWYTAGGGGAGMGITGAYQNAALSILQNGTWEHDSGTLGNLILVSGSKLVRMGFTNDCILSAFSGVLLTTNKALYIITPSSDAAVTYGMGQDGANPVVPQAISSVTSGSITVATGGNYATTGGKLMVRGTEYSYGSYNASTGLFNSVSPDPRAIAQTGDLVYAIDFSGVGYYHTSVKANLPGSTGGVSEGAERVIWLALYNGTDTINLHNGELVQGEMINVGDETTQNLLSYVGSPSEGSSVPLYAGTTVSAALSGQSSYGGLTSDNLTVRVSALTQMMADKAQDRNIRWLANGFTDIVNTTSSTNQLLTFNGGGTATVAIPSSLNNGTVGLGGTLTLAANQCAHTTINRNASFSVADLTGLMVSDITAVPLHESVFVFAYRLSGTDVFLWNGTKIPVGSTTVDLTSVVLQNRNLKLIAGGTWSWNSGTGLLSFTSDAYIQVPGLPNARNTIQQSVQSPISLSADGQIAYVTINRSGSSTVNLTVSTGAIASTSLTSNMIVIARRIGNDVVVGTGSDMLKDGESIAIDSAIHEINSHFNLGKLTASRPNSFVVNVGSALSTLFDGSNVILPFGQSPITYAGGTIDFSAGTITGGGSAFTGASGLLSPSQDVYYAVSLLTTTSIVVVPGTPAATGTANFASFYAGAYPLGQVLVSKNSGGTLQAIAQTAIYQAQAPSNGSGSANFSGETPIGNAANTVSVTFTTPLANTNYIPVVTVENRADATPETLIATPSSKTLSGFSCKLSDFTDSTNYILSWVVLVPSMLTLDITTSTILDDMHVTDDGQAHDTAIVTCASGGVNGDTITIAGTTYTIGSGAGQIAVQSTASDLALALASTIRGGSLSGTYFAVAISGKVAIIALASGAVGGALSTTGTSFTLSGSSLTGHGSRSYATGQTVKQQITQIDAQLAANTSVIGTGFLSGEVKAVSFETVPTGWLECNGQNVLRATYPNLFAAIALTYTAGLDDGVSFNIPDYRGRFLRGWDHGAGRDPDAASRTARPDGTTGDHVGTVQADAFKSHTHTVGVQSGGSNPTSASDAQFSGSSNTGATGGNETRPVNVNVMYIIKA